MAKKSAILKATMMAMVVAFAAMPALAGKVKPPAASPLTVQFGYAIAPDGGSVLVKAQLVNTAYPAIDMEGKASLRRDGEVVATALLGPGDKAVLESKIPLDGAAHEICVHFEGTQRTVVRNKVQISPVTFDQCQQYTSP